MARTLAARWLSSNRSCPLEALNTEVNQTARTWPLAYCGRALVWWTVDV